MYGWVLSCTCLSTNRILVSHQVPRTLARQTILCRGKTVYMTVYVQRCKRYVITFENSLCKRLFNLFPVKSFKSWFPGPISIYILCWNPQLSCCWHTCSSRWVGSNINSSCCEHAFNSNPEGNCGRWDQLMWFTVRDEKGLRTPDWHHIWEVFFSYSWSVVTGQIPDKLVSQLWGTRTINSLHKSGDNGCLPIAIPSIPGWDMEMAERYELTVLYSFPSLKRSSRNSVMLTKEAKTGSTFLVPHQQTHVLYDFSVPFLQEAHMTSATPSENLWSDKDPLI